MPVSLILAAVTAQQVAVGSSSEEHIIVTASRDPVARAEAPVSATLFSQGDLEALGFPFAADVLRLVPGLSVASTGPKGTQTQIRIRGAEANHSLLFVDGIRFNDPAAGNEARFELLGTDGLSRLEVVRGPQSALWGSEALGGVVAIETPSPSRERAAAGLAEYGGHDSARISAQLAGRFGGFGLSATGGWMRSEGIDSFGGRGERDGFDTRFASAKAVFTPSANAEIGVVGHWIEGESEYDGFDPLTFRRADTLDSTDNRILAGRIWGSATWSGWSLLVDASLLESANRNVLDGMPLNSTFGERLTLGAQLSRRIGSHHLTGAIEQEAEDFRAEDRAFAGMTDQHKSRELTALVGQWRAEWSPWLTTDVAVRHDDFSAFDDATTARASVLLRPARQWTMHAAYGEGIAQPTFYDLHGFFPGSFVGNPALKPESSTGWEAGLRWIGSGIEAGITGFAGRLRDEIVDVFDPETFLSSTANVSGRSRRRGIELDARHAFSRAAELSVNYLYLDADERRVAGGAGVREPRRPRHSASATLTGGSGPLGWGASLAYVGDRDDTDFDLFPARKVVLDDYLLASLMVRCRVTPALETYARVENGLDAEYQDVVGYNTPGRTVYAGLRVRLGD